MQPSQPFNELTLTIDFAVPFSEDMPAPTYDLLLVRHVFTGVMLNKQTLSKSDGEDQPRFSWLRMMSKAMLQPTGFATSPNSCVVLLTIAALISDRSPTTWWTIFLKPKKFYDKSSLVA